MADEDDRSEGVDDAARVGSAPRQGRRLSDKILVAFHQACLLAFCSLVPSVERRW